MRLVSTSILLAATVLMTGCGDGTVVVRGSVSLDGKPADEGSVSFQPADGNGPSSGGSVKDGRFEAAGLLPGKYKVTVRAALKTGKQIPAGPPNPPGTMMDELIRYPQEGKNPEPEIVEVSKSMQPLAFDLKTPPKK